MSDGAGKALVRTALALAGLMTTSACDIVQGFQNAGDALFPPQKTYLETPGFRLAAGGFHRLNVGIGDELYLLARDPDLTAEPALYSMRYLDPKPCKIDGVVRYWSSGLPSDHPAQIAYLGGNGSRGPLYFADARCNVHDLVLPDADLPLDESDLGILISSGTDLVLVDPPKGTTRTVASGIQRRYLNGPGAHFLVIDGRLRAYSLGSWDLIGTVGEGISAPLRGVGGWLVYEDVNGVHGVAVAILAGIAQLTEREIDPDGCRIGSVSGSVLAYYSPCPSPEAPVGEQPIALYDASKDKTTHLDYAADPLVFAIELDPKSKSNEPSFERDYWYYSLRGGEGTLVARSPEGEEFVLGTGARLERTNLEDEGEWGLAVLDATPDIGRLVRWERDGSVETLATDVLYGASDTIVNWNGSVGDRARISDDGELEILLEGVPSRDYEYQDASRRWRAIFDESSNGITGTLSIDATESRTFANKREIARGVRHGRHRFLDVVLPGIAYVSNYDIETDTGQLEYNNLELGFRGIISEGVADFIPAANGILYTVPFGSARGVWLARAQ